MTPTIKTITIEQLAEKLGGNLWVKGDLKRIYLDEGYNTKKMSTKTYVYQREDGSFGVSCYIDCPSQAHQWIQSQQQQVISSVEESIARAEFEINNPGIDYDEHIAVAEAKKELAEAKSEFEQNFKKYEAGYVKDYANAISWAIKYNDSLAAYENMTDEANTRISELTAERESILGAPGSAKRSKEIKNELSELPSKPNELGDWVKKAVGFGSVDEYVEFKLNEKKQSLGL